jgi:GntR family transcriptional repressor for pyruvate dehydrogenase complex
MAKTAKPITADYGSAAEPPRASRAQGLAEQMERHIVENSLTSGDRLGTKDEIRLRFRVAAATVNEALRILEMKELVQARPGPGGGVFVSAPAVQVKLNHLVLGFKAGDAPFSDCLAVRNALEPLVCREASRYCTARHAKAFRAVIDRMERSIDDPAQFLRLNWELHRRLASAARNQPLKTLYLTLLDFVEGELADVRGDEGFDARDNLAVHRELIEAIVEGDQIRLRRAIEAHMPIAERWANGNPS